MLMTIKESASFLGITEGAMRRRIQRGTLPYVKLSPRTIRLKRTDLEAFIENGYKNKDLLSPTKVTEDL